jgi:hypothetical protein
VIAVLAAVLLIQAAPAPSDADKTEAALKRFGDRTYRILLNGKRGGTLALKTRIERDKGQPTAVFDDDFDFVLEGTRSRLVTSERASLDRLRLLSNTITEVDGDKQDRFSITVDKETAHLKGLTGRKTEIKVPDTLMGQMSVLRRMCISEQKEGVSFPVALINARHERLQIGHVIRCLGKQKVDHDGKKIDAWKWEEKGDVKFSTGTGDPGYSIDLKVDNTYWVGPDGTLLRFTWGELELILDVK